MRFKQFLEEAESQTLEDFVLRHCQPLMKELNASSIEELEVLPLFRGVTLKGGKEIELVINNRSRKCYIKDVRQDRKPLDTNPDLSDMLDDFFSDKFGWSPRRKAMFAFGQAGRETARYYGSLCQVYPMGDFRYIWGNVGDLTQRVDDILGQHNLVRSRYSKYTEEELENFYKIISTELDKEYFDDNLRSAIKGSSPREIMIDCKQYLAVPVVYSPP